MDVLDGEDPRVEHQFAMTASRLVHRAARALPYPTEQVRAVTLLADGGRLWLTVTAAVPIQQDHDLDPDRVAEVDLGIIHPYAVVTEQTGLLVSGRAIRAENYLHLKDQQARRARAARRAPAPGSAAHDVGGAIWLACGGSKLAIAVASTRPSIRRPSG
jgi:hypothetical protein